MDSKADGFYGDGQTYTAAQAEAAVAKLTTEMLAAYLKTQTGCNAIIIAGYKRLAAEAVAA